ncbi:hypothetical protein [Mycoplasmopsis synoviae]|uniref:Putative phase-variable hemagglutinin n=1 Tax=Mycoplasmopsis synoviae (strain 53) TaxID=262723 RepID=Q4A6G3_MYCS5|nr:hypothetical protein [Mycoplasmopsis synoviae]AAZ43658.2 putative phase-variable hemagglutinin [Mycoplasmopsis synoviae 53]
MPKIVVPGYQADGAGANKAQHETANRPLLQQWFEANQDKLSLVADQLTKKLGSDKFKNVTLTNPVVTYEEITVNSNTWKNPKVTFNIQAKPGYQLTEPTTEESQISLSIRVLYENQTSTQNLLTIQGAYPFAAPRNATVNDENVKSKVNVYLNYTGPSIVLDADLPTVGGQENTSINGTSNVTGDFNNAFRGNPSSGLLFTNRYANPLLKSVINYVNKFDPKYRATFVTDSRDGVTITKVENTKELRPGTLDDLLSNKNKVFLQQIKGDKEAVYFAVTAIASNNWLNTFLIRIPLTKFVRPLTEFQAQSEAAPTEETSGEQDSAPTGTGS